MANFLDMRCPKCGNEDRLDIQATLWVRVCEDRTASSDGAHDYEPGSPVQCEACGHSGAVRQFENTRGAQ